MKRLLTTALFALSSFTFGATLTPIQLLSPAGSVSGQVPVSTGPTTPPTWGTVSGSGSGSGSGGLAAANNLSDLANVSTARTNLGLTTAATTAIGASGATIPLLSAANTWALAQAFSVRPTFNGATPWDSTNLASPAAKTGDLSQFAATTSAKLAGVLSDETGSGVAVFGTSPTIGTPTITGVTSGAAVSAGNLGQIISSEVPFGSTVSSPGNGVQFNITSISLPPGYWMVWGNVVTNPAGSTTTAAIYAGISTTSATLPTFPNGGAAVGAGGISVAAGQGWTLPVGMQIVNIASTTTYYLVIDINYNYQTSGIGAYGFLGAVRLH